jgi:hypothetical protein
LIIRDKIFEGHLLVLSLGEQVEQDLIGSSNALVDRTLVNRVIGDPPSKGRA